MRSVNIRQFADAERLKTWLRAGKTVELLERDKVIARIVPEGSSRPTGDWPDFAAMRREIFGESAVLRADIAIEKRSRY
ncbi:MAG: hypothetical protein ABSB87_08045 [Terriglobales bacterium]|jgi:antitoxin (DNA-binding transcriptional repressor) of toxin-antitoxin stability system